MSGPLLADPSASYAFARDELTRLVEIPSFSGEEHEAVDHVERLCEGLDLPVRRQRVEGAADNLVIGWSERPALLLTAHIDTIVPTWGWSRQARVEGDLLFGLGAQDDKGCLVACVLALLLAREAGVPLREMPVGLGICVDEEVGGKGSIAMAEELRPRFVVGAEGSELDLGLAEVGFVDAWYTVRGRSSHGALREEGDNAIEKAARLIAAVHEASFASVEHPLLGRAIPSAWEIHGGQELNVVPDEARLRIDARVVPGPYSAAAVEGILRGLAEAHDAAMDLVEPAVEPFETSSEAPLARAMAAAVQRVVGEAPGATGLQTWTDVHNFVDLAGSEAVVFGPGHLRRAHRPDESVDLREVVICARVLAQLLAGSSALLEETS